MKYLSRLVAVLALFASVQAANASTVLMPTDGDVNVIDFSYFAGGTADSYAIFDADTGFTGTALTLFSGGGFLTTEQVVFSSSGGIWTATNESSASLVLGTTSNFIIGALFGSTWYGDIGYTDLGANTFIIDFDDFGTLQAVDVTTVVPEPSTMLLLLLGMATVLGLAVRREG